MHSEKKIARSYTAALFGLALENGILEEIWRDITFIEILLKENPELVRILASPVLCSNKKTSIINALLSDRVNELTLRFLHLLVKAMRVLYLLEITDQFQKQYKAHHGIVTVHLKSAFPMDDTSRKQMTNKLLSDLNAKIDLKLEVDKRLIGGFVLQVEDRRYDASLKSKLNQLNKLFDVNIYKKKF
jgi:F-type H+-transporting ATPase subunit delta